jgi:integrase/recombinase XerD
MSRKYLTDLGRDLVFFFEDFLPSQRGLSPHTIRSYRGTLVLLLQFSARETRRGVERLAICDLTEERIVRFLRFLEVDRKPARSVFWVKGARCGCAHYGP